MNASVLGGGFGVYAYIPAALALGWNVTTLEKYKVIFQSRPELKDYLGAVAFVSTETSLVSRSQKLVIARTPQSQFTFVNRNLQELRSLSHLYLEKPLSESVSKSMILSRDLNEENISFSICYLFPYTPWFHALMDGVGEGSRINFTWIIPKPSSDWKKIESFGGGLMRFYFIQLLPICFFLGFQLSHVKIGCHNSDKLQIVFQDKVLVEADVRFDSSIGFFDVSLNNQSVFRDQTPFGPLPKKGFPDQRIPFLSKYLENPFYAFKNRSDFLRFETYISDFFSSPLVN